MSYRKLLDEILAEMSVEPESVLETGRTDIIVKSLKEGNAIGFLPEFVILSHSSENELVRLDVPDIDIMIWKQLIHHKDKWIFKPLFDFIEYVTSMSLSGDLDRTRLRIPYARPSCIMCMSCAYPVRI